MFSIHSTSVSRWCHRGHFVWLCKFFSIQSQRSYSHVDKLNLMCQISGCPWKSKCWSKQHLCFHVHTSLLNVKLGHLDSVHWVIIILCTQLLQGGHRSRHKHNPIWPQQEKWGGERKDEGDHCWGQSISYVCIMLLLCKSGPDSDPLMISYPELHIMGLVGLWVL